jgi:hypothetical protein
MRGRSRPRPDRRPTDRRRLHAVTERNLVLGGFGLALGIGGLLIWRFWGVGAAALGLLCMGSILSIFALLLVVLRLLEIAGRGE